MIHPLPWTIDATGQDRINEILDSEGVAVVETDSGTYEPDVTTAKFIVEACNGWDEALCLLAEAVRIFERFGPPVSTREHVDDLKDFLNRHAHRNPGPT